VIKVLDVDQQLVEACDVGGVEALVAEIETDAERVRLFQGSLGFRFPRHEEKGMLLCFDEKVRAWVRAVHEAVPHLLYYMHPDPAAKAVGLLLCSSVSPFDLKSGSQEEMDAESFQLNFAALFPRLRAAALFAERFADDWRPIVDRLVAPVGSRLAEAAVTEVEAAVRMSREADERS
jgi:hypothetical protein